MHLYYDHTVYSFPLYTFLWPEDGPQWPKHVVVSIINRIKDSCILTYPTPSLIAYNTTGMMHVNITLTSLIFQRLRIGTVISCCLPFASFSDLTAHHNSQTGTFASVHTLPRTSQFLRRSSLLLLYFWSEMGGGGVNRTKPTVPT